jgi:hypothetical protein
MCPWRLIGVEPSRPFMSARACFQDDQTGRQSHCELGGLAARYRPSERHHPIRVNPRTEKVFFAKSIPSVETAFMGLPVSEGSNTQLNPDTSVSHRDEEVPYIR